MPAARKRRRTKTMRLRISDRRSLRPHRLTLLTLTLALASCSSAPAGGRSGGKECSQEEQSCSSDGDCCCGLSCDDSGSCVEGNIEDEFTRFCHVQDQWADCLVEPTPSPEKCEENLEFMCADLIDSCQEPSSAGGDDTCSDMPAEQRAACEDLLTLHDPDCAVGLCETVDSGGQRTRAQCLGAATLVSEITMLFSCPE